MKIALAQLNPTVGDVPGNSRLVLEAAQRAADAGAELLVTSELVVSGYPPKDLLLRSGYVSACDTAVADIAANVPAGLGVLVGHPSRLGVQGRGIANAASLVLDGQIIATRHKTLLPSGIL